jgi:hypothetical protein
MSLITSWNHWSQPAHEYNDSIIFIYLFIYLAESKAEKLGFFYPLLDKG